MQQARLDSGLVKFLVHSGVPVSLVEDPYFQQFLLAMNPGYLLPGGCVLHTMRTSWAPCQSIHAVPCSRSLCDLRHAAGPMCCQPRLRPAASLGTKRMAAFAASRQPQDLLMHAPVCSQLVLDNAAV